MAGDWMVGTQTTMWQPAYVPFTANIIYAWSILNTHRQESGPGLSTAESMGEQILQAVL